MYTYTSPYVPAHLFWSFLLPPSYMQLPVNKHTVMYGAMSYTMTLSFMGNSSNMEQQGWGTMANSSGSMPNTSTNWKSDFMPSAFTYWHKIQQWSMATAQICAGFCSPCSSPTRQENGLLHNWIAKAYRILTYIRIGLQRQPSFLIGIISVIRHGLLIQLIIIILIKEHAKAHVCLKMTAMMPQVVIRCCVCQSRARLFVRNYSNSSVVESNRMMPFEEYRKLKKTLKQRARIWGVPFAFAGMTISSAINVMVFPNVFEMTPEDIQPIL